MQENSLLVFVISPNIGAYINAMTHTIVNHGINKIVLIHIDKAPIGKPIDFGKFRRELEDAIEGLPDGKFKDESFVIPEKFSGYSHLRDIFKKNHVVKDLSYDWLKSNLQKLLNQYDDCIIDLTGVVKRVAFDIFVACSYFGIDKIATFELKDYNKRGVDALYHNLTPPIDCEYVFLHNSEEFIRSLDAISTKKNLKKLIIVVVSILLATFVTYLNYRFKRGSENDFWIYVLVTQIFAIFGGILPILDAWGGIKISKLIKIKRG